MMLAQDFDLLERQHELQVLSSLIEAACHRSGQLVVVEGAAGIGKTRLITAARAEAERAGMRVLSARGSELEREFAYGKVRQLFEPVLARVSQADRDELLAGAASQAAVLFGQVDAAAMTSAGGDVSFATLHGLFWLTTNLCGHQPLMLVMDDLHWSDAPSLRFLAYLLPRLKGLPLLLLAGLRPAEPATEQHLLAQVTTDPLANILRPARLSTVASAQLLRRVLDGEPEEVFCLACHTASGGNPLLLRELADLAVAEGIEPTAAGAARLDEIGPPVVGRRVALRLGRLGPAATALCGAVAILGPGARLSCAAALAGLGLAEALDATRQLIDIEILHRHVQSSDEPWLSEGLAFVHPLVRNAVYEGLSEAERLSGHARAARLLTEGEVAAEQVAAHLLSVPPDGNNFVITTLRRAADEALARGSPESAVSYLERCLQELPTLNERGDVLIQLGTAAQLVDMAKAAKYLRMALALVHDPERRGIITEMLGRMLFYEAYSRASL